MYKLKVNGGHWWVNKWWALMGKWWECVVKWWVKCGQINHKLH